MGKALIVIVVSAIVLLVVCFAFGQYVSVKNTLVSKNEAVKAAWSQVDIVLQRRADLIPNLVETVKGYAQQEVDRLRRHREGALRPAFRGITAGKDRRQRAARRSDRTLAAGCRELSAIEVERELSAPAG